MKAKALIATYYWPPSGGPGVQRYLKFAKYLPQFGVEPIVLTVENPTYPLQDPSLLEEVPDSLTVYRSRTVEPFSLYAGLSGKRGEEISPSTELQSDTFLGSLGSWIRANIFIPDARAGWLLTAARKAATIIDQHHIDTIITTGPPHSVHFIGKHLKQQHGVRWLADFRDPWSQIYYNQLLPRTAVAEQLDEKLEQMILKQADEVIVVSRTQAESFRKQVERGYRVITNGFDPEDFESITPRDRKNPRFTIRHVGTIGEAAIPGPLLDVLATLPADDRPLIEFIGDVHRKLPERVRKSGLTDSVQFTSYLPHHQALEKMCRADALLLSIPDVDQMEQHIPGKLFEYLGSGCPILMLGPVRGESARILREETAGLAVPFRDKEAIRDALQQLLNGTHTSETRKQLRESPWSRVALTRSLSELILNPDPLHHNPDPSH